MGDNQTGPLDDEQATAAFSSLADEDNEEQEEVDGEDAEDSEEEGGEPESDDEDDEEGDAENEDDSYTVKVDGKEIRVSRKELLSSYQRQADYTKKSMALAEERKSHEAELTSVRQERQTLAHCWLSSSGKLRWNPIGTTSGQRIRLDSLPHGPSINATRNIRHALRSSTKP